MNNYMEKLREESGKGGGSAKLEVRQEMGDRLDWW